MQKRFAYPQPVRGPRRVAPGAWSQPQEDGGRDKTGGPILNQHLVPGAWSQVRDLNLEKMEMGTRTGYIKLALHPILCLSQLHSCTDDSKARPSLIICRVAGVRSLPYAALTGLRTQSPPPSELQSPLPAMVAIVFLKWTLMYEHISGVAVAWASAARNPSPAPCRTGADGRDGLGRPVQPVHQRTHWKP